MPENYPLTERDLQMVLNLFRLMGELRIRNPTCSQAEFVRLLAGYCACPIEKVAAFYEDIQRLV